MSEKKAAIVLAAGKGKRMKSDLPKVLHRITGKPMIVLLLETLQTLNFDKIVVVIGHKGELVKEELADFNVDFVWQKEQRGTGHAVQMAEELFREFDGTVLVAAGDVPFLSRETILNLFDIHQKNRASATCLTAILEDPTGYGRIIKKDGTDILVDIVEEKDADEKTKEINEINSGTFCFYSPGLFRVLGRVDDDNAQGEYYLTDTIKILTDEGKTCAAWPVPDPVEVKGVNSAEQLEELEKEILGKRSSL